VFHEENAAIGSITGMKKCPMSEVGLKAGQGRIASLAGNDGTKSAEKTRGET
jgi:hypothetical protein